MKPFVTSSIDLSGVFEWWSRSFQGEVHLIHSLSIDPHRPLSITSIISEPTTTHCIDSNPTEARSTMGALLSLPLLGGGIATIGSSLFSGFMLFMGGSAASAFCKSCNCNSSIATRVGFGVSIDDFAVFVQRTVSANHDISLCYS